MVMCFARDKQEVHIKNNGDLTPYPSVPTRLTEEIMLTKNFTTQKSVSTVTYSSRQSILSMLNTACRFQDMPSILQHKLLKHRTNNKVQQLYRQLLNHILHQYKNHFNVLLSFNKKSGVVVNISNLC